MTTLSSSGPLCWQRVAWREHPSRRLAHCQPTLPPKNSRSKDRSLKTLCFCDCHLGLYELSSHIVGSCGRTVRTSVRPCVPGGQGTGRFFAFPGGKILRGGAPHVQGSAPRAVVFSITRDAGRGGPSQSIHLRHVQRQVSVESGWPLQVAFSLGRSSRSGGYCFSDAELHGRERTRTNEGRKKGNVSRRVRQV